MKAAFIFVMLIIAIILETLFQMMFGLSACFIAPQIFYFSYVYGLSYGIAAGIAAGIAVDSLYGYLYPYSSAGFILCALFAFWILSKRRIESLSMLIIPGFFLPFAGQGIMKLFCSSNYVLAFSELFISGILCGVFMPLFVIMFDFFSNQFRFSSWNEKNEAAREL